MLTEVVLILLLIVANGVLSGAEIAVVSMRAGRLAELVRAGKAGAAAVGRLRANPERFLATVQVGITVVGVAAAAFSGAAFTARLEQWLGRFHVIAPYAHEIAFTLVVAVISYLSVTLGELVPKSIALRASERYATIAAKPLEWLAVLSSPIVWALTASSNVVLRLFGDHTNFVESKLSLGELRGLVEEARAGGTVPSEVGKIAGRALDFSSLRVGDVMLHRRFVVALALDAEPDEIREVMLRSGHRRTPIYERSLDEIVGYVSWRDVLARVWERAPVDLKALARPCEFVPESALAHELLHTLRSKNQYIAIVLDEHGGTAGIVTLEDLLEEFVGEIVSEHDAPESASLRWSSDGNAVLAATMSLRDVNRELGLSLDASGDANTIGGLCIELAGGRIPEVGESFTASDGARIEIVDASTRRVRTARVSRPQVVH